MAEKKGKTIWVIKRNDIQDDDVSLNTAFETIEEAKQYLSDMVNCGGFFTCDDNMEIYLEEAEAYFEIEEVFLQFSN